MPGLHMLSERGGGCIDSEAPQIFIFFYILRTLNVYLALF